MTHIFTESILISENVVNINASELHRREHEDAKKFQADTAHEWHSMRAMRRTWLLAFLATIALFTIVYCLRALP